MQAFIKGNKCIVQQDCGDQRKIPKSHSSYGGGPIDTDSQFLLEVKRVLNNSGYTFIKKRMASDGHMVDDLQQYLRSKGTKHEYKAIYWGEYAIHSAVEVYNRTGRVELECVTQGGTNA